ncbi:hypothetical protein SAMN04488072_107128 [Lentibacillus halodurans]|uniref:DUF4185 domain-containing protein n=1 Tax=Lentibacillus halodurans TaxID=237679 RepID=A0A1I0YHK7_9BACI|nr:hypothetical protein [Lentibacillus halodurans]SFB11848.1 hypothetical protein SAMN04488072_107128 [Lentibacillus halodurans]
MSMKKILSAGMVTSVMLTCHSAASSIEAEESHIPENSTFFSTAYIEESDSYNTESQGDLWASCWSDDDNLYAANGDGDGFTVNPPNEPNIPPAHENLNDIAVSKIQGQPGNLNGETVAMSEEIGQVWNDPAHYNKKPTGMACVDGDIYLAVQDLSRDFNDVPSATILKSTDKGKTWSWDESAPMFDDYTFTTIMFLDYGKDYGNAKDNYVYAYGLDNNWRDSFNDRVEDPTNLYLARVSKSRIMDRSTWEFYSGDANGEPEWSNDINDKKAVLQDERKIYQDTYFSDSPQDMTVISQGNVVYNKPLERYIYTSWTEYTFEFYEAPSPWGPWKRFMTKDYGAYPWTDTKNGGYATTIPSKFISDDGKEMFVQSNTFMGEVNNYNFSLRKLTVEPYSPSTPDNDKDNYANLAVVGEGTIPINKVAHYGNVDYVNNGVRQESEDSWNNEAKLLDWWGYKWEKNYNFNHVIYTTGDIYPDGGWFKEDLKVQVRQNFEWVDVSNLSSTPEYPFDETAGTNKTYSFDFDDTWGDAVRIIGLPGGNRSFTSIGELAVFYRNDDPPNNKRFTLKNTEMTKTKSEGISVKTTVDRTANTDDHEGKESIILQLRKNNKPVDVMATRKDIQQSEEIMVSFQRKDDLKKYSVKAVVANSLEDFLSGEDEAEILSNEMIISE